MAICEERQRFLMYSIVLGFLFSICFLGQMAEAQNNTKSDKPDPLKDYAIPLTVAIIAAIAASWNFIQAKWNGHYFHQLILKELAELQPTRSRPTSPEDKPLKPQDRLLKSYMTKSFMHREILCKPTENKDYIFATNNTLVYFTNQIWSAFDSNNIDQFLIRLYDVQKSRRLFLNPLNYSCKGQIKKALLQWIEILRDPDFQSPDIKDFFLFEKDKAPRTLHIDSMFSTSHSPKSATMTSGAIRYMND